VGKCGKSTYYERVPTLLTYRKIKKRPTTFNRLFGVSVDQFEEILEKVTPVWEQKVIKNYKRPGRHHKLELCDRVLMLLLYYRTYTTQIFIGFLFNLDDSRVCRLIRVLEPILASVIHLEKSKKLSQEEVESLMIDATEQPIERPKKGQKSYYSGKKKRHTLKNEIRITPKGRIVHVSKSRAGSSHDFTLYKEGPPVPKETRLYVDSGYQGLDKLHAQTELPYKKTKTTELDAEEKEYNRALSRYRVVVEHIIGDLKTFRILSDRFRNKRKRHNLKFNIIAGIVNMKNGFATA
jgi:hypothetical protein